MFKWFKETICCYKVDIFYNSYQLFTNQIKISIKKIKIQKYNCWFFYLIYLKQQIISINNLKLIILALRFCLRLYIFKYHKTELKKGVKIEFSLKKQKKIV